MDLKTLQYPRHIHKDGGYRIVSTTEECDAALDAGWVLSPGDAPRGVIMEDVYPIEMVDSLPEDVFPAVEPVALRKKPGRPPKAKE